MLNNFIYAKTKALFLEQLDAGNILDEAIVFIEDTKEIWNHGTYFGASDIDLDSMMSDTSENGVQNKVVKEYIDLHSRYEQVDNIDAPDFNLPTVVVDSFISSTSTNPVQNKTIKAELDKKLDKDSVVQSDWNATSGDAFIKNKPSLATVATSGNYNDLSNKPTIPDISGKVDKVDGKGLSTNDFTDDLKVKLEGIAAGAEANVQSDWNATSGDAFIKNKPTIPAAVTESTVSGWGFTKNTGTYSKPSTGIPKSDLASSVQTSLGKADTAIQTLKTINGESIVGTGNINIQGGGGGNDEGTEVLTLYAMTMLWDLSPSMFEIPDGEELPEEQIELMELLLAMFANNASVYNKIMSSDASAKSYSVVIDYMMDYINGMACRAIVPAVLVKSLDSFRIIPSEEYVSYIAPTELPDLGYTISEDGGYSRKSAMLMVAIVDTGVIPESLVQQNARVAKLLINKQVNISNICIFLNTSSLFNSLAEETSLKGMSIVQILMEYNAKYNSSSGRIMNSNLDSWGNVGGSTNEIYFSLPGAIAKFDPYSSSPTFTEVVDFTKINN